MNTTSKKPLILVTGSSGLIGTRLIETLVDDYRVVGLDVESSPIVVVGFTHLHCDLTDDQSVRRALGRVQDEFDDTIASVVHLAAYYDFSGEPSPLYRELTVEGTRRMLDGLQPLNVEQFVFSSTLLVMKSSENDHPVSEFSQVDAEWDYPQSKLATEKVIAETRGNVPAVILRLAGVYDEDCNSIPLAQQIARIYEKQMESYFFPGDKTHGQSFIHLDDAVQSIRSAIVQRDKLGDHELFVIGEEDVMSYEQLQDRLGELIHADEWPTIRIPKPLAKAGAWIKDKLASSEEDAPFIKPWMIELADQNYPVSIDRARRRLQWTPTHTLRATLPEMVARLKRDPHRWYQLNGLPLPAELPTKSAPSS